jgi:hypothetical protein
MATIAQQNQDEENQNQTPTTGGAGGAGTGGNTSGQGGAAAPVSNVQQNAAPQNNQGYTDVGSYLNANQQGAGQLGQQVSQNLTNKYNDTKQGVDNSYNQFQGQVNQGYTHENTDLINQVASDPLSAASNSDLSSQFGSQLNDVYGGPNNWADFGNQQGNINQAQQYGSLTKTPGGLNVLTQQVEGQNGGPQSQGINQLDTLLLGGTPGATQQIQSAADPYKGLNDYINQQNTAGTQAIGQAQTAANQTSQDALNAFVGQNGTLTNLNNTINTATSTAQQQAEAQNEAVRQQLANLYGGQAVDTTASSLGTYGGGSVPWANLTNYNVGQFDNTALQGLGINQDQWNALQQAMQQAGTTEQRVGHNFGAFSPTAQVDLGNYINQQDPMQAITAANTATSDQYAQMKAIQDLLGSKLPQGNYINPLNASQAGTAPKNTNNFNYQQALSDTQGLAGAERQAAQDEANAISGSADVAHADSQHNHGFLGSLQNAITHPGNLLAAISNPASYGANAKRMMSGQNINPLDISAPYAKTVAPILGGALGYIYGGGPLGGIAGAAAGNALGRPLENLGGQSNKSYAHGGEVEEYLDKHKAGK